MNLSPAPEQVVVHSDLNSRPITRLQGYRLALIRLAWVVMSVLAFMIFIVSFPVFFAPLQKSYTVGYAVFLYALGILVALVFFIVAALIFWRKSNDWLALMVSLMLVLQGAQTNVYPLDNIPSLWLVPALILNMLSCILLFLVFCLFPTGRFVPGWIGWLVVMFSVVGFGVLILGFFDPLPLFFNWLFEIVMYCLLGGFVVAQLYRYHSVSSRIERQQTKWIVFGVTLTYLLEFLVILSSVLFPSILSPTSLANRILLPLENVVTILIPLSFGFAILRYRLWDIDIIIQRTLLYGMLTVCVVALYVLVVVELGALLQTKGNLGLSLLATGLIAVLIQPLHTRLQRAVNHLLYGERDEPYKVISRLGQRLEATLAPEAVLPTIVETVTQALKLPYTAISLKQDGEDVIAASSGKAMDELTRMPLVYQGEHIGDLFLAHRARGETFSSADRVLLADLARQAGIAVHAVRLTTDLQCLAGELQASRTQLVTTREEERRRLRRDLHDGLGSALTSMTFQLDAASNVLERDPLAARTLLTDLKRQTQAAIADIRRLVYNLRPPILDEWGLVAALREQVAQYQLNHVQVCVEAPESLPPLPAAVEVAAYRIALEALANVVRHAHASNCTIRLALSDEALTVEVRDDGEGLPEDYHAGVGISAMRERAAELGGSCTVETMMTGGTRVSARLPRPKE